MSRSRSSFVLAVLALTLLPRLSAAATTFLVSVPSSTPPDDTVFIAGDFQGWDPGHPAYALTKQPDGRWAITLNLANGQPIQFKFTRGDWGRVEKGPNGEEIANRTLTPSGDQTVELAVARWADQGTITGHVETFSTPGFLGGRRCWIYLPPGYSESMQRYPVLYMHDGQNLFDVRTSFAGEWMVDETCESLILGGEIDPLIVVGIENSAARCTEYTPWVDPGVSCGGGGDAYLSAIRDLLIPAIDAAYRTLPGPQNRWMCGSSLGGLISAYAGCAYDATWGRIAAVSPSYWWANRMMLTYASQQSKPSLQKFYQDMGTAEGASAIQNLRDMRDIMLGQGFVVDDDFRSLEAPGHAHNEFYWAQRMPEILRFIANPASPVSVPMLVPAGAGITLRLGPNPATSAARIDLALDRTSSLRVLVIDVRGRRVSTIHDGALAAGPHALRWDGRDASGAPAAAGLYWILATDGARSISRPLVILR